MVECPTIEAFAARSRGRTRGARSCSCRRAATGPAVPRPRRRRRDAALSQPRAPAGGARASCLCAATASRADAPIVHTRLEEMAGGLRRGDPQGQAGGALLARRAVRGRRRRVRDGAAARSRGTGGAARRGLRRRGRRGGAAARTSSRSASSRGFSARARAAPARAAPERRRDQGARVPGLPGAEPLPARLRRSRRGDAAACLDRELSPPPWARGVPVRTV